MTVTSGVSEAGLRRARLVAVRRKLLVIWILALVVLGTTAAFGPVAGASGPAESVAQQQMADTEAIPPPPDSDDEVRLVMALLISVAAAALLGTFIYWVRTGDRSASGHGCSPDRPEPEDTLG